MNRKGSRNSKVVRRQTAPSDGLVDVELLRAREIQLVGDDGTVRMSMKLDSQGYPRIVMGDSLETRGTPKARTLRRVVIGFTSDKESPAEVWPRMDVQVRHNDRWCAAGVAVVYRDKSGNSSPGARQVYPEICMHGDGKIRATLALNPDAGYEPSLVLRDEGPSPATEYVITPHGPQKRLVADKKRSRKGKPGSSPKG